MSLEDAILTFDNAIGAIGQNEMKIDPKRVLELAESSGCTAYDCEYVSLAERLNVPLVTSDKKLLSAFPDIAVSMETFVAETSV